MAGRIPDSFLDELVARSDIVEVISARVPLKKAGRERLSRKEKGELKELVTKKLRRELTPATRAADVSWSLDEGIVRFFSASPKEGAKIHPKIRSAVTGLPAG